jgi:hypothetical protein
MSDPKTPIPTGIALTALDPTFREQPHEHLDRLREIEPVHQDPEFDWVVLARADDINAVVNDRTLGKDRLSEEGEDKPAN